MRVGSFRRLISVFRRWSIQRTIFISLLSMVLVVAYILASASFAQYSEILLDKTMQARNQTVELAVSNIQSTMEHVTSLSRLAVLNITLQQLIGNGRLTPSEQYNYGYVLKDDFNYMIENSKEIAAIAAYLTDGRLYTSSSINAGVYARIGQKPIRFETAKLRYANKLEVINTRKIEYLVNQPPTNVVTVYRPLISYLTTNIHGILQFDIPEARFSKVFENASGADEARLFMIDQNDFVISTVDKSRLYKKLELGTPVRLYEQVSGEMYVLGDREYLTLSRPVPGYNWTVVAVIPADVMMKESREAAANLYWITALSVLLLMLPIYALSRIISRPLKQLALTMQRVGEGDFSVRADERYSDEVGSLSRVFNKMLARISELMRQMYIEQQGKRRFEFMAMQEQIKPHFLYNTLDNVCALILLQHTDEAFRMCKSLAQFYRFCLSGGQTLIPIAQEVEIVRNYLVIQEIRFKDRFTYSIELDERAAQALVPKLIVQPLVENALTHGIRDCAYPGFIRVCCADQGDYARISVYDNGVGFSEDSLAAIEYDAPNVDAADRSFGLLSIIRRLRFYNDPSCRLTAVNHPEGGCTVSVIIKREVDQHVSADDRG